MHASGKQGARTGRICRRMDAQPFPRMQQAKCQRASEWPLSGFRRPAAATPCAPTPKRHWPRRGAGPSFRQKVARFYTKPSKSPSKNGGSARSGTRLAYGKCAAAFARTCLTIRRAAALRRCAPLVCAGQVALLTAGHCALGNPVAPAHHRETRPSPRTGRTNNVRQVPGAQAVRARLSPRCALDHATRGSNSRIGPLRRSGDSATCPVHRKPPQCGNRGKATLRGRPPRLFRTRTHDFSAAPPHPFHVPSVLTAGNRWGPAADRTTPVRDVRLRTRSHSENTMANWNRSVAGTVGACDPRVFRRAISELVRRIVGSVACVLMVSPQVPRMRDISDRSAVGVQECS